jgi:hypothetical protein
VVPPLFRTQDAELESFEFCRALLEYDPTNESVQMRNVNGISPFLRACETHNIMTARYLLERHPDSINVMDDNERNCLHILLNSFLDKYEVEDIEERAIEFVGFLLERAPGLISASTEDDDCTMHTQRPHTRETIMGLLLWQKHKHLSSILMVMKIMNELP